MFEINDACSLYIMPVSSGSSSKPCVNWRKMRIGMAALSCSKYTVILSGETEAELISQIWDELDMFERVVTVHGTVFDIPFLLYRSRLNGVAPSLWIDCLNNSASHYDLSNEVHETNCLMPQLYNALLNDDMRRIFVQADAASYISRHTERQARRIWQVYCSLRIPAALACTV
ncbi:MAG: hypothetical protein C4541_11085 [Candidatus Auribacter fodinae]|uniref:Predicted 3'-5' exonuclease PolB-like domain-containing protein n=1 Tax=Candidatus Auribacter fodinae TaxID=2093366 RepID=A0A3A4QXK0_9BACT|nr:MAG: hypothetical protein C4541_11085 [Candidatus Auribacter fodinae]